MGFAIIAVPLVLAALAFLVRDNAARPLLLPVAAVVHTVLTLVAVANPGSPEPGAWLFLDAPGRLVLVLVSVLFLFASVYAVGYLRFRVDRDNKIFVACVLGFIAMMSLVTYSRHLGLGWVAVEATTLAGAPLIYFNRNPRSLEATWKYLIIGSIGIALALLGSFFLGYAALTGGQTPSLLYDDLLRMAPSMSRPWLDSAFVLLLVGYGTKMGLAPMHTWKPDAYGEAPGLAGALFAGGMTSCAFLTLTRTLHLCDAAGAAEFPRHALVVMGLLSMAIAATFVIRQRDFKRMLAYSSVEHMGILAIGLGLGGAALFGTLLHLVANGLSKGVMFLAAANIHRAYASKSTLDVSGAIRRLPISGTVFLLGFLAVTGSPPFGPFVSELWIINSAFSSGATLVAVLFLVLMMVVFLGMGATVLPLVQGAPSPAASATTFRDTFLTAAPMLGLLALVLMLGLAIPEPLTRLLDDAVRYLQVSP
ncbi:MAG: proton-conducting transporter membrane subunit [Myxococcota bacterium]